MSGLSLRAMILLVLSRKRVRRHPRPIKFLAGFHRIDLDVQHFDETIRPIPGSTARSLRRGELRVRIRLPCVGWVQALRHETCSREHLLCPEESSAVPSPFGPQADPAPEETRSKDTPLRTNVNAFVCQPQRSRRRSRGISQTTLDRRAEKNVARTLRDPSIPLRSTRDDRALGGKRKTPEPGRRRKNRETKSELEPHSPAKALKPPPPASRNLAPRPTP